MARNKSAAAREAEKQRVEIMKAKAQSMVFRHLIEKKPLADCWFEVYPESEATRKQAKKQAYRLIKWFRLNYPTAIRHLLYMRGMDDSRIIDLIEEQFQAKTYLKSGTRKYKTVNDEGETVWVEEIEYIEVRDNKSFNEGVRNLITLHGYHGRALDTTREDENAERTMRNVTEQATLAKSNADERANEMLRELERRVAEAEATEGADTHRTNGLPRKPFGG